MVAKSTERLFWLYLLCAALLALGVFAAGARRGFSLRAFLRYLAPGEVYLHPSARLDYAFFLVNRIVFGVLFLAVGFAATLLAAHAARGVLDALLGLAIPATAYGIGSALLQTVLAALAIDLGIFAAHYLQHRVPVLWAFHEVHHSASVLTPLTAYRMHPVDDLVSLLFAGTLSGAVAGLFDHLQPANAGAIEVLGVNACVFLFYAAGFNLRHSHVWLSYGPLLGRLFMSPAQHQVHHSTAARHRDRNFGFMFAFWDGLLGTLYVTGEKEDLRYGLAEGEAPAHASLRELYLLPFVRARKKA